MQDIAELIEWFEKEEGANLISDDAGRWAVSGAGFQPVPEEGGFKVAVSIVSDVEPDEWKPTIAEAIMYYFQETLGLTTQEAKAPQPSPAAKA